MTARLDWAGHAQQFVDVVQAPFGIDGTGATDCGAAVTAALTQLAASGQTAVFRGTFLVTTAITNASACAILIAQGTTFTGANAASLTRAAKGGAVFNEAPANSIAAVAIAQAASENITALENVPSTGKVGGTAPGPYADTMQSVLQHTTWDNVWHRGYNYVGAPGYVSTEPTMVDSWESNWEATVGSQWMERHWAQILDTTAGYTGYIRPLSLVYQRSDSTAPTLPIGGLETNLTFSDGAPGHVVAGSGSVGIYEANVGEVYYFTSNGAFAVTSGTYLVTATNGYTISSNSGSSKLQAGGSYVLVQHSGDVQIASSGSQPNIQAHSNETGIGQPMGGYSFGPTPFQWYLQTQALSHGGTTTLASAQYIAPTLKITDTGLTGAAVVVFPTTTGPTEWCVDLQGVTFGGQTVTLQVGTATKTVAVSAPSVLRIYSDGTGKLYAVTYT